MKLVCNYFSGQVVIPRAAQFNNKLSQIKKAGTHNLSIVSDFDSTLIRHYTNEALTERADNSFSTMWNGLPQETRAKGEALF
jgi:uncharacterized protein HemY